MSDTSANCLRIGLTGGIASGKSLVASLFARHGAPVIDTDILARKVVEPGTAGLASIVAHFSADVLDDHGDLNRAALRDRVFADPAARADLEKILHPLIRSATLQELQTVDYPYVIIAVPLLLESGFINLVDRVLVIDCPVELQRQRLMQRDGENAASAERIIGAQANRAARLEIANDIIVNDSDAAHLEQQVAALHAQYLTLTTA